MECNAKHRSEMNFRNRGWSSFFVSPASLLMRRAHFQRQSVSWQTGGVFWNLRTKIGLQYLLRSLIRSLLKMSWTHVPQKSSPSVEPTGASARCGMRYPLPHDLPDGQPICRQYRTGVVVGEWTASPEKSIARLLEERRFSTLEFGSRLPENLSAEKFCAATRTDSALKTTL